MRLPPVVAREVASTQTERRSGLGKALADALQIPAADGATVRSDGCASKELEDDLRKPPPRPPTGSEPSCDCAPDVSPACEAHADSSESDGEAGDADAGEEDAVEENAGEDDAAEGDGHTLQLAAASKRRASSRASGARAASGGPEDWKKLLKWAAGALGLHWGAYQSLHWVVFERLCRRIEQLGCEDLDQYRKILKGISGEGDADELRELHLSVLQIDISRFFRTGSVWQFMLAVVLPDLFRSCAAQQVACRCWIMGAGLGEEVYSLKACWELGLGHVAVESDGIRPELEIVVSELSQESLNFGKEGEYSAQQGSLRKSKQKTWAAWDSKGSETFKEVPEAWVDRMFTFLPTGNAKVTKRLRKGIAWRCESWSAAIEECSEQDWLDDVGGPFHFILGRHGPFFYPDLASQRRLLTFCESALEADGYLLTGRDESARFSRRVAPLAAPLLASVRRPACVCGAGPLPPSLFGTAKAKKAAPPPGERCARCGPCLGEPGRMVWKKR